MFLRLAKAKSHLVFSDTYFNTEHVVYLNIYQNLLMIAIKMHEYLRDWGVSGKRNISFLRSKFQIVYLSLSSEDALKASSNVQSTTIILLSANKRRGNMLSHPKKVQRFTGQLWHGTHLLPIIYLDHAVLTEMAYLGSVIMRFIIS